MVTVLRRSRAAPPFTPPCLLVLLALFLPLPVAAQTPDPPGVPATDSTHAVATACAVVLALRSPADRHQCDVERYRETGTEFVIRVHEQAPRGTAPLPFPRSEVRLSKRAPNVVVTREPEL